jgi:release factor glutamine methyltransferase
MTIKQALQQAIIRLKQHKCPETDPIREAGLLLSVATGFTPEKITTDPDKKLTVQQSAKLQKMIARRLKHEPVELIVGFADFFGLRLKVTKDTLIPRPATEAMLEAALPDFRRPKNLVIDVGTGSGAIALAVANKSWLTGHIIGTDTSAKAIAVARNNAKTLDLAHRVKFKKGNLLTPVTSLLRYNLGPITIIANLPYIPEGQWGNLPPEIRNFEPKSALLSGPDGLNHYKQLIAQLSKLSEALDHTSVYIEILPEQYKPLTKLIQEQLPDFKPQPLKHSNGTIFGLKATKTN